MSIDTTDDQDSATGGEFDITPEEVSAWEEFDKADEAAAGADTVPASDDTAADDFTDDDGAGTGQDSIAANETKQPAGASGAPLAKVTSKSDTPAAKAPAADPWANAPPELRAEHQKLKAERDEIDRHRRAADKKIRELSTAITAKPKAAPAPETDAGKPGDMNESEWTKFQEDYPEVAGPTAKHIAKLEAKIATFEQRFSGMDQSVREQVFDDNEQQVLAAHPDIDKVVGMKAFADWKNTQPRYVQDAIERNGNEFVDPVEVIDVIERFKAHAGIGSTRPGAAPADEGGKGKPAPSNKRQRQFDTAANGKPSNGPAMTSGIPEDGDPETLWKQLDAAGL